MYCPNCKKDCVVSELSPVKEKLVLSGTSVEGRYRVADLCSECYEELRFAVIEISRPFGDVYDLQGHLEHPELNFNAGIVTRTLAPTGYMGIELQIELGCNCAVGAGPVKRSVSGSAKTTSK